MYPNYYNKIYCVMCFCNIGLLYYITNYKLLLSLSKILSPLVERPLKFLLVVFMLLIIIYLVSLIIYLIYVLLDIIINIAIKIYLNNHNKNIIFLVSGLLCYISMNYYELIASIFCVLLKILTPIYRLLSKRPSLTVRVFVGVV